MMLPRLFKVWKVQAFSESQSWRFSGWKEAERTQEFWKNVHQSRSSSVLSALCWCDWPVPSHPLLLQELGQSPVEGWYKGGCERSHLELSFSAPVCRFQGWDDSEQAGCETTTQEWSEQSSGNFWRQLDALKVKGAEYFGLWQGLKTSTHKPTAKAILQQTQAKLNVNPDVENIFMKTLFLLLIIRNFLQHTHTITGMLKDQRASFFWNVCSGVVWNFTDNCSPKKQSSPP